MWYSRFDVDVSDEYKAHQAVWDLMNVRQRHDLDRTVEVRGVLVVTDSYAFEKALSYGIGKAKGLGCGMLMLGSLA